VEIFAWIAFGLVVGLAAKLLMPGKDPGGVFVTIALGVVGALIGGWLGRQLGMYQEQELAGFLMSVIGAVIVLGGYRFLVPRRRRVH